MSCRPHTRPAFEIAANTRFGQWTVLDGRSPKSNRRGLYALCRCDCGTEREVRASRLKRGTTNSCGCANTPARIAQRLQAIASATEKRTNKHTARRARATLIAERARILRHA